MSALWTDLSGYLYALDRALFYLVNSFGRNTLFDLGMPILSNGAYFKIPLALAFIAMVIWGGRKGRAAVLLTIPLLILSDSSSQLIKGLFQRVRPCHALEQVHLLVGCTSSYSFPSNHAANVFAIATFFSRHYRDLALPFYIAAALVGYSRIYVGVHYPSDVLAGAGLGFTWALVVLHLEKETIPRIHPGFRSYL